MIMSKPMLYPPGSDPSIDPYVEEVEDGDVDETVPEEGALYDSSKKYSKLQLEELADALLRDDANRELCRKCRDIEPASTPYGEETGEVEWQIQKDKTTGDPLFDNEGNTLYVGFPELQCPQGHRWYKGEGPRRNINGKDPILFETHIYNRRRREIYVKDGIPDPQFTMDRWGKHPVQGMYYRCVDTETQALTPSGWMSSHELQMGDHIWAYDPIADQCKWDVLIDLYRDAYDGPVQVLESQNISARTTPGHSWVVVHERDKDTRFKVTELQSRHYIPLPRMPQTNELTGREDLFELLGWVITDGTYRKDKNDALVYQALHNPKVGALRSCLKANDVNQDPQYVDENNVGRWAIPVSTGRPLRALSHNVKSFSTISLQDHAHSEYEALWKGSMYGDGYRRANNQSEIVTTKKSEAHSLQALRTIVGGGTRMKSYYRPQSMMPNMHVVTHKQTQWAYVRPALQEAEHYSGEVWCPTTTTGFWVARRNGKTFITGNTHPQGRKQNTDEQRKRNGASFIGSYSSERVARVGLKPRLSHFSIGETGGYNEYCDRKETLRHLQQI
jgi:hypothetical protein